MAETAVTPIDQIIKDGMTKDFDTLVKVLLKDPVERKTDEWIEQYKGQHSILNRPDKIVGEDDEQTKVPVNKLILKFQKKIVDSSVAFILGVPVHIVMNNTEDKFKEAFVAINDVYAQNKMDYFDKQLARWLFIETKVAELWYAYIMPGDPKELRRYRVKLLCKNNGDEINPHYDEFGDMDAFTRKYETLGSDGKVVKHVDIFTAKAEYQSINKGSKWEFTTIVNLIPKIPIIYYEQTAPEWDDVQTEIDRMELLLSRLGDTNDYYGDPTLKIWGDIENPPEKGSVGKVLRFSANIGEGEKSDAEYLAWDNSPQSIQLEWDTLKAIVHSITDTPDLTFENIKGLGSLSGITIRLLFLASMMKANIHQETIGAGFTRRLNLIKAMLAGTNTALSGAMDEIDISVQFGNPLPESEGEIIAALSQARGGEPIMSREDAVRRNPLVEDAEQSIAALEQEETAKRAASNQFGETFNI